MISINQNGSLNSDEKRFKFDTYLHSLLVSPKVCSLDLVLLSMITDVYAYLLCIENYRKKFLSSLRAYAPKELLESEIFFDCFGYF